jgi:transposase-like protein
MECPKCGSDAYVKDGIVKSKQRFKCKNCDYRYTVAIRGTDANVKQQAWQLYLQGLDYRSIAKTLNCSHVSAYNWIKAYKTAIKNESDQTD